jgi:tetratricopeptide (TPR) repeat protein
MVLFIAGTALFFARAVLVFEAIFLNGVFLYFFIWKKYVNKTLLIIGSILAIATIVLFSVPYANLRTVSRIFPNYAKQSIWQDERWEYWRQAAVAIRERPWFGAGPGTFFLQSKLYQKEPNAYSWFAHNFLLEVVSEIGLVGLALIIFVGIAIVRNSKVKPTRCNVALLVALCLVFAQSVFDYNLDYVVVWLLVWAVAGAIFSQTAKPAPTVPFSPITVISLVFIGIFYIMNMFLLYGKNIIKYSPLYIPLCTYDLPCAGALLSQKYSIGTKSPITVEKAVQFFHRRNPKTMVLLAARYQMTGEVENSYTAYREALTLDPQNNVTSGTYISLLLDNKRQDLLLGVIEEMIHTISAHPTQDIGYVRAHWKGIYRCFNASTLLWSKEQLAYTYQAKSIYYAGLCLIKNFQFDEARELLRIASDARVGWSNIYLDYAGLSFWRYHDMKAAQQAIEFCKVNQNSRQHCTEYDGQPLPRASVTDAEAIFIQ